MTGDKIFLDSNIVIELFSGNQLIADKINQLPQFYISSIVLGELYIGINRVVNKQRHLQKLNFFLEICTVLHIDEITASIFGEIVAELFKKGKPIPSNDAWIAASVKQHGLTLISNDKHFKEVNDLLLEQW